MNTLAPKERQYTQNFDDMAEHGPIALGPMGSHLWRTDPRHLGFSLARYKFVAKMLHGHASALEIGCGDGFGAGVVGQEVGTIHGLDFDPLFVDAANKQWAGNGNFHFFVFDMLSEKRPEQQQKYAAVYSLDVLEHIEAKDEDRFFENLKGFLQPDATVIIGCPSLESQAYASKWSKAGHVNCKSGYALKAAVEKHFEKCFLFGMNDEVLHTGYSKMSHYNLILACNPKL